MLKQTCLNGFWDFAVGERMEETPVLWEETKIQVPSPFNINSFSEGYKRSKAGEEFYVGGADFTLYPEYPDTWDEAVCGFYKRNLYISQEMQGKRLFLRFDAVAYHSVYYINGDKIQEETEGFLPIEFEITDQVRYGCDNEVIVAVQKAKAHLYKDENGRNRTDFPEGSFWGLHIAGIWQDAWLIERGQQFVSDVFAQTDVYQRELKIRYEYEGSEGDEAAFWLTPLEADGTLLEAERKFLYKGACSENEVVWNYEEGEVQLWETDHPALYQLTVQMYHEGILSDETSVRIGFRTFRVEDDKFILNGKPIKLKNDSWHYMGYSIQTPEYARSYYQMAKDANVNIIRLHAQPFPTFFYDIADEMGMLLVSESAVWASHCNFSYNPQFFENSKKHLRRLIKRDRNHPSVVMWSPENECIPAYKVCGSKYVKDIVELEEKIYDLTQVIPQLDDTRIISCDGSGDLGGRMQVNSLHYPGYDCPTHREKPITIGEMGSMYFSTPDNVGMEKGESVLGSMGGRLEAVADDAFHNLTGQRKWAAQVCVFNLIWYGLEPLPFEDRILTYEDYTAPGIKPTRITPFLRTLNAGGQEGLKEYIPNEVFRKTREAFMPVRFFAEQVPTNVWASCELEIPVTVFNDHRDEKSLILKSTLTHAGRVDILEEQNYELKACTFVEDKLNIMMPDVEGKVSLTLLLSDKENTIYEETFDFTLYQKKALEDKWKQLDITVVTDEEDIDTTYPSIDFSKKAPYGDFMKHQRVCCIFNEKEKLTWNHEVECFYFQEYLNFSGRPLYFNGTGMPVAVSLIEAGIPRILCGLNLLEMKEEPSAYLMLIHLGEYLKRQIPVKPEPVYYYGDANTNITVFLDEIRCEYECISKEQLMSLVQKQQTRLLLADGSKPSGWMKRISEKNFSKVMILGARKAPDWFAWEFEVTEKKAYHLQRRQSELAEKMGVYGNSLYGLAVGSEEALASNLLQYRYENDAITLGVPDIDWRVWNHNAENLKTVSILKSEKADNRNYAAVSVHRHAGSEIIFNQLSIQVSSRKAKNNQVRLLSALGAEVKMNQNSELDEVLSSALYGVGLNRMLYRELGEEDVTKVQPGLNRRDHGYYWKPVKHGERIRPGVLAISVYSPQDRTDLLLNPDTVDMDVIAEQEVEVYLNGALRQTGTQFKITSIMLTAGWNQILLVTKKEQKFPDIHFMRTNLKALDLKFSFYDRDIVLHNLQKVVLGSTDSPDKVSAAIGGDDQYWQTNTDQHNGMDFFVEFNEPVLCRAIYMNCMTSDIAGNCLTPYRFKIFADDGADELHEIYQSGFEDRMYYPEGKVFVQLGEIKAKKLRIVLTDNALKPFIIKNLMILS